MARDCGSQWLNISSLLEHFSQIFWRMSMQCMIYKNQHFAILIFNLMPNVCHSRHMLLESYTVTLSRRAINQSIIYSSSVESAIITISRSGNNQSFTYPNYSNQTMVIMTLDLTDYLHSRPVMHVSCQIFQKLSL